MTRNLHPTQWDSGPPNGGEAIVHSIRRWLRWSDEHRCFSPPISRTPSTRATSCEKSDEFWQDAATCATRRTAVKPLVNLPADGKFDRGLFGLLLFVLGLNKAISEGRAHGDAVGCLVEMEAFYLDDGSICGTHKAMKVFLKDFHRGQDRGRPSDGPFEVRVHPGQIYDGASQPVTFATVLPRDSCSSFRAEPISTVRSPCSGSCCSSNRVLLSNGGHASPVPLPLLKCLLLVGRIPSRRVKRLEHDPRPVLPQQSWQYPAGVLGLEYGSDLDASGTRTSYVAPSFWRTRARLEEVVERLPGCGAEDDNEGPCTSTWQSPSCPLLCWRLGVFAGGCVRFPSAAQVAVERKLFWRKLSNLLRGHTSLFFGKGVMVTGLVWMEPERDILSQNGNVGGWWWWGGREGEGTGVGLTRR